MTGWYLFRFYIINEFDVVSDCVSDLLSGESNLAQYLASWYDAFPILDFI